MNRTVRIVSLLRWAAVAAHTALATSAVGCLVVASASRSDQIWRRLVVGLLMLLDLPVTLLGIIPAIFLTPAMGTGTGAILSAAILIVLGGIQWYLIASLLARWTCGFTGAIPFASRRFGATAAAALVLVGLCGWGPWLMRPAKAVPRNNAPYSQPALAFNGESTELRRSVIVPTLDTPIPEGTNVVWCGTFELAWKRLGQDVLGGPPNVRNAEGIASGLNSGQLKGDDLPVDSYVSLAGFAKDGVVERAKSETWRMFRKEVEIEPLAPNDILAYSYLETNVPFALPFFEIPGGSLFRDSAGAQVPVTSFGISEKQCVCWDLREQVDVRYSLQKAFPSCETEEFVLDLCRESSPNQILLARVPRKATLQATLDDLELKSREFASRPEAEYLRRFGPRDVLLVPNLNWELRHRFRELEGSDRPLLNAGFTDYHIAAAVQRIRFRLDRSGAELASEAQIPCAAMDLHYLCDRPFLIVVKRRDAQHPFFVMWVDNAELLSKP